MLDVLVIHIKYVLDINLCYECFCYICLTFSAVKKSSWKASLNTHLFLPMHTLFWSFVGYLCFCYTCFDIQCSKKIKVGRPHWIPTFSILCTHFSDGWIVAFPVPAKIASFDEEYLATYKEDVKLLCQVVGLPTPDIRSVIRCYSYSRYNFFELIN